MSSKDKKYRRCRSSKRFCEEKLCCKSVTAEAFFQCDECGTFQCFDCATTLHTIEGKFSGHIYEEVKPYLAEELCQIYKINQKLKCERINFSDVHCEKCDVNFCFSCFDLYHKGPNKSHKKLTIKEFKQKQETLYSHFVNQPIQPVSPLNGDNDSLTFVSCPQLDQLLEDTDSNMESFDSANSQQLPRQTSSIPDLCLDSLDKDMTANLEHELAASMIDDGPDIQSFMLLDDQENLQVSEKLI